MNINFYVQNTLCVLNIFFYVQNTQCVLNIIHNNVFFTESCIMKREFCDRKNEKRLFLHFLKISLRDWYFRWWLAIPQNGPYFFPSKFPSLNFEKNGPKVSSYVTNIAKNLWNTTYILWIFMIWNMFIIGMNNFC